MPPPLDIQQFTNELYGQADGQLLVWKEVNYRSMDDAERRMIVSEVNEFVYSLSQGALIGELLVSLSDQGKSCELRCAGDMGRW